MDIKKSLGTKVGPLPMAAWAAIVLIGVIVVSAYRKKSTTTTTEKKEFQSTAQMNDWTSVAQIPQPIIVNIPSPAATPSKNGAPVINVTVGSNQGSTPSPNPARDQNAQLRQQLQANADAAYRAYQQALAGAQAKGADPTADYGSQRPDQRIALEALRSATAASNAANDALRGLG